MQWNRWMVMIGLSLLGCAEPIDPWSGEDADADALAVVRGTPVEPGVYPFMIYANGCSASLISPSYVLMAAHCFGQTTNEEGTLEGVEITSAPVLFGHPDRQSDAISVHDVAKVHMHPNYLPLTVEERWGLEPYDVALLELTEPILLPAYLRLPTRSPTPGEGVIAAGWGLTEEGRAPAVMHETVLTVVEDTSCYVGDEIRFCTNGNETKSNIGAGDSGGPVFVDDGDGFMVLGTNSTSNGDTTDPVAMHARTIAFVPWILSVAGDEFACDGEGEARVCEADIDECALELDACGAHGVCENTVEAYTCACDEGFIFEGSSCIPEPEEQSSGGCNGSGAGPAMSWWLALGGLGLLGGRGRRTRPERGERTR